ncbi:hypothetical protein OHS33_37060 [Streptomyces sp. NBC_00536]|uniref:hypothetical protein n=1 Tax=Streptomyces sp. NBC_00536 TaxID=2975769 RepID=UPI002E806D0E|nr:hypothetical protein [Streptomyces sp. NBC_00536]WUC83478.1 hypothetical protein OHS33_37060 [Streptomyces sp. NBC_00536]
MIERVGRPLRPMTPEIIIPIPPAPETRFHTILSGVARWSSVLTTLLVVGVVVGEVDEATVFAVAPLVFSDRTGLVFAALLRR